MTYPARAMSYEWPRAQMNVRARRSRGRLQSRTVHANGGRFTLAAIVAVRAERRRSLVTGCVEQRTDRLTGVDSLDRVCEQRGDGEDAHVR